MKTQSRISLFLLAASAASAVWAAPVITGPVAYAITANEAWIQWYTNVGADETVDYGTTAAYGSSTTLVTGTYTNHLVHLTGLSPTTQYHYRVSSNDGLGSSVSADQSFTTLALGGTGHVQ